MKWAIICCVFFSLRDKHNFFSHFENNLFFQIFLGFQNSDLFTNVGIHGLR